ncbi:hypothetical protein Hypma_011316 [Hypsizygus marmoreus]|uniref:Uncharacterized protein n=1 Tax=Hypsizygus marmoreus TaxID=39966 RepID=A0A369JMP6_HYPMA|nr:hypothetical protein Hypma_011316 [Hypsizygus marmoreus]
MKFAEESQRTTKYYLLEHYAHAWDKAFTVTTIQAVFCWTGIWPVDHTVIEESVFEPAINTTIQSAQPVPITPQGLLPNFGYPSSSVDDPIEEPFLNADESSSGMANLASHEDILIRLNMPTVLAAATEQTAPAPGLLAMIELPTTPAYRLANYSGFHQILRK